MSTVFTEYAWDMGWCDPCAANPLSQDELRNLGVFWLGESSGQPYTPGQGRPPIIRPRPQDVFMTRLHVRYDADAFPGGSRVPGNRRSFELPGPLRAAARWKGEAGACEAARRYVASLPQRRESEAQSLASLTGWNISEIRKAMGSGNVAPSPAPASWWQRIWKEPNPGQSPR